MTLSEKLIQTWNAVIAESPGTEGYFHRRIPLECAWPAHAGVHRPTNARILILEMDAKLARGLHLNDEARGYIISLTPDDAGRIDRVTIRVQETGGAHEIFLIFCTDILEHWILPSPPTQTLSSLMRRLSSWKRFFQRSTYRGLGREEQIGLYGELSLLEAALQAGMDCLAVVSAWHAPFGANQDFLFGALAVEVKAVTGNDLDKVRITNARQLDSTGLRSLLLVRYAFDFREGSGRTLPQLVASIKTSLATVSPDALSIFCDRILEVGFLEEASNDFDAWGFTNRRVDMFVVDDEFPRLLESNLPAGISEISYTLNLSAATEQRITESAFWSKMTDSHV